MASRWCCDLGRTAAGRSRIARTARTAGSPAAARTGHPVGAAAFGHSHPTSGRRDSHRAAVAARPAADTTRQQSTCAPQLPAARAAVAVNPEQRRSRLAGLSTRERTSEGGSDAMHASIGALAPAASSFIEKRTIALKHCGVGVVRRDLEGAVERRLTRLDQIGLPTLRAHQREQPTSVGQRFGVVGVDGQHAIERLDRVAQVALSEQRAGAGEVGVHRVGEVAGHRVPWLALSCRAGHQNAHGRRRERPAEPRTATIRPQRRGRRGGRSARPASIARNTAAARAV